MNPFLMSAPTVLVCLVLLFILLRDLRRVQRTDAAHEADYQRKMAEISRQREESEKSDAASGVHSQAELIVNLELSNEELLPDLQVATQEAQPLVSALSQQEQLLGGLGFALTAAKVGPGSVRLTLSPIERSGSAERVKRVADEMNSTASALPPGVTAAHAVILAM
jgi:hypothetical protein